MLRLSPDRSLLVLEGGQHLDALHVAITAVPGWRATSMKEQALLGAPSNRACYVARPLPAAVVGVQQIRQTQLIEVHPEARERLEAVQEGISRMARALAEPEVAPIACGSRRLMEHQHQALVALEAAIGPGGGMLIADDMGLGKSLEALTFAVSSATRVVVICPASVKHNWQREIEAVMPPGEDGLTAYVVDGSPKRRLENLRALETGKGWVPWAIVINYDLLKAPPKKTRSNIQEEEPSTPGARWRKFLTSWVAHDGMLIVDESHYVKEERSGRSRAVAAIAAAARWRLCLTGTPIRDTPRDLWHQLEIVEPGIWRNSWDFERRYERFQTLRFGKRKVRNVIGNKNEHELGRILSYHQIRRRKTILANLPPKMPPVVYEIEMDDDTRAYYTQMRDWWLYTFKEVPATENVFAPRAKTALEAAVRLAQIAQGIVHQPPTCLWVGTNAKAVWLIDMVKSLLLQDAKPVIWSQFNFPLSTLSKLVAGNCKLPVFLLTGDLNSKEKDNVIRNFEEEPKAVFFGQVRMAEGFNLVSSQDVIFYGRDWSPAINVQAEDRVHRIGQKGTVNIHIPLVKGTVEREMHRRLENKEETANKILTIAELREMV